MNNICISCDNLIIDEEIPYCFCGQDITEDYIKSSDCNYFVCDSAIVEWINDILRSHE